VRTTIIWTQLFFASRLVAFTSLHDLQRIDEYSIEAACTSAIFKCSWFSGIIGGIGMVEDTVIDDKGRITIPKRLREELDLREGSKVKLVSEDGKIVIMKPVTPNEFIREMEGFIEEGSAVQKANPLKLKEIWEKQ
jgi:AbrB family looped-hinge helix DNA binding protein